MVSGGREDRGECISSYIYTLNETVKLTMKTYFKNDALDTKKRDEVIVFIMVINNTFRKLQNGFAYVKCHKTIYPPALTLNSLKHCE